MRCDDMTADPTASLCSYRPSTLSYERQTESLTLSKVFEHLFARSQCTQSTRLAAAAAAVAGAACGSVYGVGRKAECVRNRP